MIDHAEHFRGQARECRRLSGRANRRDDVRVLTEMADELDAEAEKIESEKATANVS
jgi:hypothetical protein